MAVAARSALLALAFAVPAVVQAQQLGVISGQVTESGSGAPVPEASVRAIALSGGSVVATGTTGATGRFSLAQVPAGRYAVEIQRLGYTKRRVNDVVVETGQSARVDVTLEATATGLQAVSVTAGRTAERVQDAPRTLSIVPAREINDKPVVSPAQSMRGTAGVDMAETGLNSTTIVTRGFNNAFSGTLLMLQDYRFANVPSLRVNIPSLMSSTPEDIERIEVVLGPGAALYGPNAASGVMHVISKSPFNSKGTTITIDGGERSLLRLGARHAGTAGERFGFKLSGEYMRGKEWEYVDSVEAATGTFPATPVTPPERVGQPIRRDFDLERAGGEGRIDYKLGDNSEVIASAGIARVMTGLELTGANGTAQVKDWMMQHYQLRYRNGRFFAQAFGNLSNAGNEDGGDTDGTFLLRTGQPIVDYSRLGALQFQHGFDMGERQTFLYGADYTFTNPRTDSTIHGRNEDDDNTTDVGGYLHSASKLTQQWEFQAALRGDYNSRLDEFFVSPRAALLFKPTSEHSLRFTYDRAYSTPGSFQNFLDLLQGSLRPTTGLPYDVRALGVPQDGFRFRRDCTGGISDLCMRSPVPFANGTTAANDFTGAVGYQNALAIALQGGLQAQLQAAYRAQLIAAGVPPATADVQSAALAAAVVTNLRSATPTSTEVGSKLKLLVPGSSNPFGTLYSADSVVDIAPLKASFVNNLELGYNGTIGKRLVVTVDGWYQRRENFITAAANFTPTVFVDTNATRAYLTPRLTPILGPGGAAATATSVANALARIPAGNVVPDSRLTTNADFAFTYRNLDQAIDLFGSDLALDLAVTDRFSVVGTYSWVSKTTFTEIQSGGFPLSLNAPDHKASLTARWADEGRGFNADLRGRYTNTFFVNSGVYFGTVPVNMFVDASVSWRLPFSRGRTIFAVNASNVLDNQRPMFAGVPDIGRMVITRLQHTF